MPARLRLGGTLRVCGAVLLRGAGVLAPGVLAEGVAWAEAAEVVLAVPAWVGQPVGGGQLQLALGTRSAPPRPGALAVNQEGWQLTGALAWPLPAGQAFSVGESATDGRMRWAIGLRQLRFDAGALGSAEAPPGAEPAMAFSGRGTGWSVEMALRRPARGGKEAAGEPPAAGVGRGSSGGHPQMALSARVSWLPVAGPVWKERAGGDGMTAVREREVGHAGLTGRRAAVGVSLWASRPGRDRASRLLMGVSAGFTHSAWAAGYRGAFSRWMSGMPVAAGERWATADQTLQAFTFTLGLAWERGPVVVALSAGALSGTRYRRSTRAERLDPRGEPLQRETEALQRAGGHLLQLELRFSPGGRVSYRVVAHQVILADADRSQTAREELPFPLGVGVGSPWVGLPYPHRAGVAGAVADGRWHWQAAVVLEL